MDNKVTVNRIKRHLEYDWFKYILIAAVSIFVWYFVFMEINRTREYERVDIFFACYSSDGSNLGSDFKRTLEREGDTVTREVNVEFRSPYESYYTQLYLAASGMADVLIVTKREMDFYGPSFLELTDEVLAQCLPEGVSPDFYVYEPAEDAEKVYENLIGKRYGIRLDNLPRIADVDKPPFVFDPAKTSANLSEEELNDLPTEFYAVFRRDGVKIGEQGKEEKYRDLTQAYRFVKYLFEKYGYAAGSAEQ